MATSAAAAAAARAKAFEERFAGLEVLVGQLKVRMDELEKCAEFVDGKALEAVAELKGTVTRLEKGLDSQGKQAAAAQAVSELRARQHNVMVFTKKRELFELSREEGVQQVGNALIELVGLGTDCISRITPLGKNAEKQTAQFKVSFTSPHFAIQALRNKGALKREAGLGLQEDLTLAERKAKSERQPLARQLFDQGVAVDWRRAQLVNLVDGRWVSVDLKAGDPKAGEQQADAPSPGPVPMEEAAVPEMAPVAEAPAAAQPPAEEEPKAGPSGRPSLSSGGKSMAEALKQSLPPSQRMSSRSTAGFHSKYAPESASETGDAGKKGKAKS
jgi:hypothetical protein